MSAGMTEYDQMFSVREAPWHMGMGTNVLILDSAPETRMDRMVAAGHDWVVEENEVWLANDKTVYPLEKWKALTRSDTGDVLHVVRGSYEVIQNIIGHEVFEALAEGARMDDGTGGTVRSGAVCYLCARLDEDYHVEGDDSPVFPYVVTTWAHDLSGGLQARRTTARTVCWNTLSYGEMVAKRAGRNFVFRHTKNVMERIEDAKAVIAGAREDTLAFIELSNELGAIKVSEQQREDFIAEMLPVPPVKFISNRVLDNVLGARSTLRGIFDSPTIPDAHKYTGYGLMQAGIEYLDHLRGYQSNDTYLGRTLLRDEPLKRKLVPLIREVVR